MGFDPAEILRARPDMAAQMHAGKVAPAKPKKSGKPAAVSSLEATWANRWDGPELVAQHRFHPERQWKLDFAHPATRVGIELHGGVWTHGRHNRGGGFVEDRRKMNAAIAMGWVVVEFTAADLDGVEAYALVRRLIEERSAPRAAAGKRWRTRKAVTEMTGPMAYITLAQDERGLWTGAVEWAGHQYESMPPVPTAEEAKDRALLLSRRMGATLVMTKPVTPMPKKGEEGGRCNRTVCANFPATWWNPSTRAYYCPACARHINEYNPGLCVGTAGEAR
jgi:hypothetical protein